jgi:hypothetical protein
MFFSILFDSMTCFVCIRTIRPHVRTALNYLFASRVICHRLMLSFCFPCYLPSPHAIFLLPVLSAIASCIPPFPSCICHCPAADKPLAYPTSAKTKRDWTAVGKEVQQEEADEKPQGEVRARSDKVSLSLFCNAFMF